MKRILIIDDEVATLTAFKKILSGDHVSIDIADMMECAETLLRKNTYDVVITDLRLTRGAGEEGFVLLNYIKKVRRDTRVIFITGNGNPEVMTKAYQEGCDYFLVKPVSAELIKGALRMLGVNPA